MRIIFDAMRKSLVIFQKTVCHHCYGGIYTMDNGDGLSYGIIWDQYAAHYDRLKNDNILLLVISRHTTKDDDEICCCLSYMQMQIHSSSTTTSALTSPLLHIALLFFSSRNYKADTMQWRSQGQAIFCFFLFDVSLIPNLRLCCSSLLLLDSVLLLSCILWLWNRRSCWKLLISTSRHSQRPYFDSFIIRTNSHLWVQPLELSLQFPYLNL